MKVSGTDLFPFLQSALKSTSSANSMLSLDRRSLATVIYKIVPSLLSLTVCGPFFGKMCVNTSINMSFSNNQHLYCLDMKIPDTKGNARDVTWGPGGHLSLAKLIRIKT